MEKRNQYARSRRSDWMTDCNSAAVHIHFSRIPAQFLVHCTCLCRESFVRFDEIEIIRLPARFLQRGPRSGNRPAPLNAEREGGIGRAPMIDGSPPACAQETIRARIFLPCFSASEAFIITTAAAPSLMPEAFPAVTVPSLSKAGRNFVIASIVAP